MTGATANAVLRHLRQVLAPERDQAPDGQLLERFVRSRDEEAFAALVRRHGGLVLGVCRRVLHHPQDAEDAFQATFLVLARQAASIRSQGAVGGWLYRVAYRVALRSRAQIEQRRQAEGQAPARCATDPLAEVSWREVQDVLDSELTRLPEKYRLPLLLCYLEGQTQDEAARQLGWRKRTLKARLNRGRDLLRGRLARHGLPLGAALAATLLPGGTAGAMTPALVGSTSHAAALWAAGESAAVSAPAAALARGALGATAATWTRALAVVLLGVGTLVGSMGLLAGPQEPPPVGARSGDRAPTGGGDRAPTGDMQQDRPAAVGDAAGDPLPPGARLRLGTVRLRHGGAVNAIVWAPDGKWVASAGGFSDRTVRLWDPATGKEIRQFPEHRGPIRGLALSPDGKTAVSVGRDSPIHVWDPATGKQRMALAIRDEVRVVAFAPDGRRVLVGGMSGSLQRYDVSKGVALGGLPRHGGEIRAVAWSPDGKTLASVSDDKTLRLWDAATGKPLHTIRHDAPLDGVAFAPDSKTVAVAEAKATVPLPGHLLPRPEMVKGPKVGGGSGQAVRLWDVASGKPVAVLEGHTNAVRALAFAPDGKTLASASDDWTVRLWDLTTRKEVRRFTAHRGPVWSVAFSPDGKRLASGGNDKENTVRIWEAATGREVCGHGGHNGWVGFFHLFRDGRVLLTAGSDGTGRLWDFRSGKMLSSFDGRQARGKAFTTTADGKLAATGGSDWKIHLLELPSGRPLRQLVGHTNALLSVCFARDGKLLASSGHDRTTRLWDVATGQEVRRLGKYPEVAWSFAFSSDGKTLLTGSDNGMVRVWEVASGKELYRLEGHQAHVEQLTFSPDERLLATAGGDGTVRLWDLAKRTLVRRLDRVGGIAYTAVFSRDGRTLATGGADRFIGLWEVATGKQRGRIEGHRGALVGLEFLPDGRSLLSGASDSTALIWDLSEHAGVKGVAELKPADFEAEWRHLTGADSARAYRALWALAASPRQTLTRLRNELRPVAAVDEKQVAQWIAELDHRQFAVREKAMASLRKAGDQTWPALRKVLRGQPTLEVRGRVLQLLADADMVTPSAERLRLLRTLELLERVSTPEARQLIETLMGGAPSAWLSLEARQMMQRLRAADAAP
ncbi:MAG: sigma-70 family RNA polymerase sigma factor [Gemmataceae bacterium]|nr:sigma-70 family RNA polymerase sigma factor [Gemmataceae bacterium]